ncbi:MAG: DUF4956 domain-containing protein [Myxococcota bacterium]
MRLVIYYLSWLLVLGGIFHLFPQILYYVDQEHKRTSMGKSVDFETAISPALGNIQDGLMRLIDPAHTIPILVALILAFAVTLPITWVYRWTRPRKKYNQAFAHTLLMVPIAIALVVFLVKGSLALAFSLAGIVAAVRFRTALEEPLDAVYMFMAIGIGLATGIQLTTVAYIASLVFVILSLGVWKSNYGARPAVVTGWTIQPEKSTQTPGSKKEGNAPRKSYNAQLQVHTTKADEAQLATTPVLANSSKRWQLAEVIQNEDGTAIVVFDIWLKKSVDLSSFIRDIEKSGKQYVDKVELKRDEIETA